jgi:hypothetical protein
MHYILVDSATRCRHPEYQSYESRLSSFTDWPTHLSQKPEDLADAGLYHIGKIFSLSSICVLVRFGDNDNFHFLQEAPLRSKSINTYNMILIL